MEPHEQIELIMPEDVGRLLEERQIRKEDVQRVIYNAETNGEKFVNPATGRSLASFRPDRVTYWVEYTGTGDRYEVHTAYSHRMEMKRGKGL